MKFIIIFILSITSAFASGSQRSCKVAWLYFNAWNADEEVMSLSQEYAISKLKNISGVKIVPPEKANYIFSFEPNFGVVAGDQDRWAAYMKIFMFRDNDINTQSYLMPYGWSKASAGTQLQAYKTATDAVFNCYIKSCEQMARLKRNPPGKQEFHSKRCGNDTYGEGK